MARPKFETNLNEEQIIQLARIGCNHDEIAAVLGCHANTVGRRFGSIIKEGHIHLKASLKRMQFQAAAKGNVTMMIWLGKQFLEQKDMPIIDQSKHTHFTSVSVNLEEFNRKSTKEKIDTVLGRV